jgi:hypothetical protein
MKASNHFCASFRTLATFVLAIIFTSVSLHAQTPEANQPIRIATIPSAALALMAFMDTKVIQLPGQNLAAPLNSVVTGTFRVPADGNIKLQLTLKHIGNQPINHTVRIELINPHGVVVDKELEFIVKHNEVRTATLTGVATTGTSGCSGLNTWKYRVINNDNVNHQITLVDGTATVPDATGFRTTFPSGGYTLAQNAFGDFVFKTPKGHNGGMKIKIIYNGASTVEARLFKAGVEPSPNEANAIVIKSCTESGQTMLKSVVVGDVTSVDQFWTVRLRNKAGVQVTNAKITVEFTDCFE